jgi:hypothetical protein
MNRSILIVICDFLLLSLLTFSTDLNRIANDDTQRSAGVAVVTNAVAAPDTDLVVLMKQALADEHKGQEQLQQQLALARNATGSQQELLARTEQENARLKQQSASLQQQSTVWQQQYAAAQTNLEDLTHQLQNSAAQARLSREELAAKEAEARKESELAANLKQQVNELARSNQLAQAEQARLAGQLQLSEVERRAALDRAGLMQQQAQAAQAENVRLAEGFKVLATNSSQLTQEIRENRALAPNTLFSEFVTNRVRTALVASRTGFLGLDLSKDKNAETMLVTDGTNIFALCHVDDTPLTLWDPGTDWDGLAGKFTGHAAEAAVPSISFHRQDPRVVMFPVSPGAARQLGCKIYRLAADPYKFQDAVIIGADSGYYGQCDFQIDLNTPQYVRLDRNLLKGLFGKFNPSRGDVVLSRTGELLGLMVNSTYCLVITDFATAATLAFGPNVRAEHTGGTLARLYGNVFQMPLRLQ